MANIKQEIQEALADAIQLRRPASEIAELRARLEAFDPQTAEAIRAKQDAFLSALRA